MATQHPEDATRLLTLRRSNVDRDFYPQKFGHEEVVETMDKDRSRSSSPEELWKRKALEASPRKVHPETPHGSSLGREIRGIAERPGRSLQNARAQEMAEPPQRMNSSEFWQAHPMDELIRLAAELNRHLEVGIPGLTAQRSGPTGEQYFPRITESRMPSVVQPTQSQGPTAQRCGPTDERYSPRFIESGMPSVVQPAHGPIQHPDVRFQTPLSDAYGYPHGLYLNESPASRPDTTEAYYSARVDREWEVLSSKPRPTPVPAFHAGMHEVHTVMPEQRQVCGFSRASKRAVDPEDAKVGQTQHSPAKRSHSSSSLRHSTSPDTSPRKKERTRYGRPKAHQEALRPKTLNVNVAKRPAQGNCPRRKKRNPAQVNQVPLKTRTKSTINPNTR